MSYTRFAIYYIPSKGPLAEFGAAWLGWDVLSGFEVTQFDVSGLADITTTPRKYGFHGTLKPPFRLKDGETADGLANAIGALARTLPPATCDGLKLTALGRFLALVPEGSMDGLRRVADACVRDLDGFRAPASDEEIARRRTSRLSARQDRLLTLWGYPFVFEEFRFHMTLTGRLPETVLPAWTATLRRYLPDLPAPFVVDQIALCGERTDGRFQLIHRYTLAD